MDADTNFQIITIDPICLPPDPEFDPVISQNTHNQIEKIPILQIFSTTMDGKRECLLFHGMFSTIYIDCPEEPDELALFKDVLMTFISKNFDEINQLIYSMESIRSTSIYGYNHESSFLKIELLLPHVQQQLSRYLSTFVWNGKTMNVYQGHIPFFLNFFAEFNLTGCGIITLKSFVRKKALVSKYETEIHFSKKDIIVKKSTSGRFIEHFDSIYSDQIKIRKKLNIETQVQIVTPVRQDLLFSQRPPEVEESQIDTNSQELTQLLSFLEKYDPNLDEVDENISKIEKEEIRSQKEIDDIEERAPEYHTLKSFVPGRISQVLQESLSQESETEIESFVAPIINKDFVFLYQKEPPEVFDNQPETDPSLETFTKSIDHSQYLTLLFIEIGTETRGKLHPNPKIDSLKCIAYSFIRDRKIIDQGIMYFGKPVVCGIKSAFYETESDLLKAITKYINIVDPDLLIGFNTERESYHYINERAKFLGYKDWYQDIARTREPIQAFDDCRMIGGRVIMNIWRILRFMESYRDYTLTTCAKEILGFPFPQVNLKQLQSWYETSPHRYISYIVRKLNTVIKIVMKEAIIENYTELSLVVGLDFCSTLSRGSQFYTESLLCRVTRKMGYLLITPTKEEVASERAPMSLPLVMEPLSGFYQDPIIVLDFTSLYPSSMIAYNLCYCTCAGRSINAATGGQLGFIQYKISSHELNELINNEQIINTPNDVLFVTPSKRKGVMGTMLAEVLELRAYIKQTLKVTTDPKIKRILNARQKAIKMFAACVYGYTNAHYSGRMPLAELGDSIVECSRHMLEFVINHIESNYPEFQVLYGDTDSIFIKIPAVSIKTSFEYGEKLCNEITSFFPYPITIKIEKIFKGAFLVNKKRYCGWIYESSSQVVPTLDVKGLEMKRRDSCLLVANVMRNVIETIFKTKSEDAAKEVFLREIQRICSGNVPLNEFMFKKEVRLGTYKVKPPSAYVIERMIKNDPMAEPLYGERIPYVIVSTTPGARLYDKAISPEEFIERNARISTKYYIERQIIPALGRVLETMGIDINSWVHNKSFELKKLIQFSDQVKNLTTIERYCKSSQCPLCYKKTNAFNPICSNCFTLGGKKESIFEIIRRKKVYEQTIHKCDRICSACLSQIGVSCSSCFCENCDVFWKRHLAVDFFKTFDSYQEMFEMSSQSRPNSQK